MENNILLPILAFIAVLHTGKYKNYILTCRNSLCTIVFMFLLRIMLRMYLWAMNFYLCITSVCILLGVTLMTTVTLIAESFERLC